MPKQKKIWFLRLCGLCMLMNISSCTSIAKIVYGYKDLQPLSQHELARWTAQTNRLNSYKSGSVDTAFIQNIFMRSSNPLYQKVMAQFIVVMAFDSGYCRSIKSNCYFGGFPNLKWDDGTWEQFPFRSAITDSICRELTLFNVLHSTDLDLKTIEYNNKCLIILCGNSLKRQSHRLIKTINKKYPDVNLFLLNNDNFLFYLINNPNILKTCQNRLQPAHTVKPLFAAIYNKLNETY